MEGVRLQAGQSSKDVRLVVSTIAELEFILPVLQEFRDSGRHVNVLYGIPLLASQVSRLAAIARQLGTNSICVLVDHASQLDFLARFFVEAGFAAGVYLKVDTGYHRAGLPPSGLNKDDLVPRLMELEGQGKACFIGLYSHSSLSYNDSTAKQAMANLEGEINGCIETLSLNAHLFSSDKEITVSVGASPQVTSVENLLAPGGDISEDAEHLRATLRKVTSGKPHGFSTRLELHAGVYSILDVQQMSTRSRHQLGDYEDEIAISVVAEVCSVYNGGEREQPEALAAVGVLGLGREPCVAYKGWGIIDRGSYSVGKTPEHRLVINRVSQEHCIVAWAEGAAYKSPIPLEVSQSIRIYPNHACVTGALYGWYLVVDSSQDGNGANEIVDVWIRASGW
jgi:D-serine ammonia-lyase